MSTVSEEVHLKEVVRLKELLAAAEREISRVSAISANVFLANRRIVGLVTKKNDALLAIMNSCSGFNSHGMQFITELASQGLALTADGKQPDNIHPILKSREIE